MRRVIIGVVTLLLLLGLLPLNIVGATVKPQPAIRLTGGEQCFSETGHCLRGLFRGYWLNNGGVNRFGLPITDELNENGRTVQYTERARFELHPEFRNTPNQVELGLLGNELAAGRKDRPFQPAAEKATIMIYPPVATYITATKHNLSNPFFSYWQQNGGLAVYGYPISEAFEEVSPTDGKSYLVQYFERNRLEYHPELPAAYQISLGLLGKQSYQQRYGNAPAPVAGKDYGPAPISLDAFRQEQRWGDNLQTLNLRAQGAKYNEYAMSYTSGELTISGLMYVPTNQGDGPFPVIIMGHGFLTIDEYYTGEDSRREGPYLASNGYVAIHPDFRSYATSTVDPDAEINLTAPGWTEDSLNLIDAIQRSKLSYVDGTRIGYWGHSNGGQVGLQLSVTQSDIKAFVLFAPTSPVYAENFTRWQRNRSTATLPIVIERHGLPETNPAFYNGLSFAPNVARVNAPMLIFHGQSDTNTPYAWSVHTNQLLVDAGKNVTFVSPRYENHLFSESYWPTAAQQMLAYYNQHVR